MSDKSLDELRRRCEVDPKNEALRRQYILELVRHERFDQITVPVIEHSYSPPTEESLKNPIVVPYEKNGGVFVPMLDQVLGKAAELAPALVYADMIYDDPLEAHWVAHRWRDDQYEKIEILHHEATYFRPMLAHLCFRSFMGNLYGGYTGQTLKFDGREYALFIHVSNDGRTGFWARFGISEV